MAGIYVASKAVHGPMWRELRAAGAPIASTWIDECGAGETDDWADLWDRCVKEAHRADGLVMYGLAGETMKGALLEIGATLAAGSPVAVVGCAVDDHSFLHHPLVFRSPDAESALREIAARHRARPSPLWGMAGLRADVVAFHVATSTPVASEPCVPTPERAALRVSLMTEEAGETVDSLAARNLPKVADGLADTIYVAVGTAVEFGVLAEPFATRMPGLPGIEALVADALVGLPAGADLPEVPVLPADVEALASDIDAFARRAVAAVGVGPHAVAGAVRALVERCVLAAVVCGIPIAAVWAEVQRSNMAKADPFTGKVRKRADGKVLKPEGWREPDIEGALRRAGWQG